LAVGLENDSDRESVGRLLWLTAKASREVLNARLQRAGSSHPAWLVLHALVNHGGEGSRQRDLADRLCIEGPTLTRHLDHLQARGLIERRPDPDDRRSTRISSTAEGRRVLKSLWSIMERAEGDLVAGLSMVQVEGLRDGLGKLLENIERAAESEAVAVVSHRHSNHDHQEHERVKHVR
jgi:MarR family transcriptional regulator, transcriptional regulator for hemolysin